MSEEVQRRTKRRYAHELYPHAEEGESRPLAVEVPYLYARAIGLDVTDTGWFDAGSIPRVDRMNQMIDARRIATMADAIHQGLSGQAAWDWVIQHSDPEGEWFHELASKHIEDMRSIKPYPCGPIPTKHEHWGEQMANGWSVIKMAPGPEDECDDCTEPIEPTP